MKMNDVKKSDANYANMWAALKPTLSERPHKVAAWADLGVCEYYYIHDDPERVSNSSRSSTGQAGKASGKGKGNLMSDGTEAVVIEVMMPEHLELQNITKISESAQRAMSAQVQDMTKIKSTANAVAPLSCSEDIKKINEMIVEIDSFIDSLLDNCAISHCIDAKDLDAIKVIKDKLETQNCVAEATVEKFGCNSCLFV